MKISTILIVVALLFLGGCASSGISNGEKFRRVVEVYKLSANPSKALYLAYQNENFWAFGLIENADTLEQAIAMAREKCEINRLSVGISAQCAPYYEGSTFVGHGIIAGSHSASKGSQKPSAAQYASGTCFAISENGVIVTANHVVDGASEVFVTFPDGSKYQAEIASISQRIDIAILAITASGIEWLPFATPRSYNSGDYIFTLGYPVRSILGDEVKFTDGSISALTGIASEAAFMQVSAPVQPGNSGGPILTANGEVIGVLVSSAALAPFIELAGSLPQNMNWATNIDFVRPLIPFEVPSLPASNRRSGIERAKAATCIVEAKI